MVGRDGFEPSYLAEQIYSLSPLTTRPPAHLSRKLIVMATPIGFEPTISCVTGRRFEPLSYGAIRIWWAMTGSNRRHPACKAGALPAELITLGILFGDPYGIRTRVTAVKGRCLRPLDQRATFLRTFLV